MLRIGEFSQLSSISIHMLRNYDKIGLLVPKSVDEISGYRYYEKEQLVQGNQIIALKSMGFGLEEIKEIMGNEQSDVDAFLKKKLGEKLKEIEQIQEQVRQISGILNSNNANEEYMLSIARKTIEPMWVISYREKIATYQEEGVLWEALVRECERNEINISDNSIAMAIYHGIEEKSNRLDVEVQFPLSKEYKARGNVSVINYPERDVVSAIFKGSYTQISSINTAVAEWLEKNSFEISGQSFTIYHNSPGNCNSDKDFITEICFPIHKK
jgi:DNA-binding transcriptional MerR regulator